ncbi:hypothetical protein N3K66_002419 [Trichothecium roseum]|uniref:Uncharacterized protein n=1 Tax=Trichothecium roseum TaxID=47278 RepID=A0ACC0VAZ3_9HYPO|nr:hypothetical protein N3K66_002419 [Trichothecium roseum]
MKVSMLLGLPALVAAAALAPRADDDHHLSKRCTVNAAYLDTWHEAGLQRRRTAFSAAGTIVELFCNFWKTECGATGNVQCGYDDKLNPPSWRVDQSFVLGVQGDSEYWFCLGKARDRWIEETGCDTG